VNFEAANLALSVFHRAQCVGTDFRKADLQDADFSYARLTGADMRGAHFLRTRFHGAMQEDTRFSSRGGIIENDPELYKAQAWSGSPR